MPGPINTYCPDNVSLKQDPVSGVVGVSLDGGVSWSYATLTNAGTAAVSYPNGTTIPGHPQVWTNINVPPTHAVITAPVVTSLPGVTLFDLLSEITT